MTFNDAVMHAWLSDSDMAEFFGVTTQTVKKWKQKNKAPVGVIQAIKLIAGDCPALSKKDGWHGWAFAKGYLWSPEMIRFKPEQVLASVMDYNLILMFEKEVKALKDEIRLLKAEKQNTGNVIPFPLKKLKCQ